ncbi:MAG: endonuclease/exonuclease/phosphatase [Parcubacteria group bacterium Gr01-1014_49]|nr:MAG: endonuclease/exonuclease/phosphatase [Parcubacteria group bacterium Gr01-1014_49]
MRVISLNTWGGRAGREKLLAFFKTHAGTTDVFCLQEMWSHAYEGLEDRMAGGVILDYSKMMVNGVAEVSEALPNFTPFFRPHVADHYGLLMFVREEHIIIDEGETFVFKQKGYVSEDDAGNHARNIQYATIMKEKRPFTIINFHGLWNGKGKTDTEDRILQSKNILAFLKKIKGECVLCGDFNLLPDTESIKLFEGEGLRNLIKEYGITSTRTSFYTKPEKHADYIFVTGGIDVRDFKVLPDEVSDHSPLLVDLR